MSTLSVHYIQGTAAYNNTVTIPSGHSLETPSLSVGTNLNMPTWDESTKPTANLTVGQIGYNTELGVVETWSGDPEDPNNPGFGWVAAGDTPTSTQSLQAAVGVQPYFHFQSDDLANYSDGQVLNQSNPWINNGSLGNNYDMINDTSGHYSSNVTVTTANGVKCAQFSGFCALAFKSASYLTWVPSNQYPVYTVAYVFSDSNAGSGSDSTPTFMGHAQGPSTGIPDRVGGGLFGKYLQANWGSDSYWSTWYDNDGGAYGGTDAASVAVANQWIERTNTSSGLNSQQAWRGKTPGPHYNGGRTGISLGGGGPTYGANLILSGMGNVRRADSSAYTTSGKLYEAALFREALSDSQIQAMRDYFAAKYPFGNIAS